MPYVHDVVVVNPSSEKNLQLLSFYGDNTHFHVSFSKSQVNSSTFTMDSKSVFANVGRYNQKLW